MQFILSFFSDDQVDNRPNRSYTGELRVLSALTLLLGGNFFAYFNTFMIHDTSVAECKQNDIKWMMKLYIIFAAVGFMLFFSTALISYELFLLCRENRISNPQQQWKYLKCCYALTLLALVISFGAHSISLYIAQCGDDFSQVILLIYIPILIVLFLLTIIVIGLLNHYFVDHILYQGIVAGRMQAEIDSF